MILLKIVFIKCQKIVNEQFSSKFTICNNVIIIIFVFKFNLYLILRLNILIFLLSYNCFILQKFSSYSFYI